MADNRDFARLQVYWVGGEQLCGLLRCLAAGRRLADVTNLPADAEIVGVNCTILARGYEDCVMLKVWSMTFEVSPEGLPYPKGDLQVTARVCGEYDRCVEAFYGAQPPAPAPVKFREWL